MTIYVTDLNESAGAVLLDYPDPVRAAALLAALPGTGFDVPPEAAAEKPSTFSGYLDALEQFVHSRRKMLAYQALAEKRQLTDDEAEARALDSELHSLILANLGSRRTALFHVPRPEGIAYATDEEMRTLGERIAAQQAKQELRRSLAEDVIGGVQDNHPDAELTEGDILSGDTPVLRPRCPGCDKRVGPGIPHGSGCAVALRAQVRPCAACGRGTSADRELCETCTS